MIGFPGEHKAYWRGFRHALVFTAGAIVAIVAIAAVLGDYLSRPEPINFLRKDIMVMHDRHGTEKVRLNLSIHGKRTTLNLEAGVWASLTEICRREEVSLDELAESIIATAGDDVSMASALRMYALAYFRKACDTAAAELAA